VAAVKNVDPQLLGEGGGPMCAFAGDECVRPFRRGDRQRVARAAGDDADFFANSWPAVDEGGFGAENGLEPAAQNVAAQPRGGAQADGAAAFLEEGLGLGELERAHQPGVVAEARMEIQRQVRAVNSEVVLHERLDEQAFLAGPWMLRVPKQAVMDDEQIGLRLSRHSHRGQGGVDRRGDAAHTPVVLHLQAVVRAVVVFNFADAQGAVAVLDDLLQQRFGHAG